MTLIGGPTVLIEIDGWRLLTDPTFDPAGEKYHFGWGARSEKLEGPAIAPAGIGEIDAVLLSHEHHDDNLDPTGRDLLPGAGRVLTTVSGAAALRGTAVAIGLDPWEQTILETEGKPTLQVTATPCRHGPPLSHPVTGDVIGFALSREGEDSGAIWITGDTVLYGGVLQVADRIEVDNVLIHLGAVTFPMTGPFKYTMDAADAVELCDMLGPRHIVPVHYEGWKHFREGRAAVEAEFAKGPEAFRRAVTWLEPGRPQDFF